MTEEKCRAEEGQVMINQKTFSDAQKQNEKVKVLLDTLEQSVAGKKPSELSISNLIDTLVTLKALKDDIKIIGTLIGKTYDRVSIGVVPDRLEEEELESVTVDGHRLEIRAQMRVSTPKPNQAALMDWFIEHDMADMATTTISAPKLKAMVKEAMEAGEEFPAHLLSIHTYKQSVVVKR